MYVYMYLRIKLFEPHRVGVLSECKQLFKDTEVLMYCA